MVTFCPKNIWVHNIIIKFWYDENDDDGVKKRDNCRLNQKFNQSLRFVWDWTGDTIHGDKKNDRQVEDNSQTYYLCEIHMIGLLETYFCIYVISMSTDVCLKKSCDFYAHANISSDKWIIESGSRVHSSHKFS